jgi:hypothetical protein
VGRVIAAKTYNDKRFILKMKRIELWRDLLKIVRNLEFVVL